MKKFPIKNLRRNIAFFLILVTASLCLGLLINQFRDKPLPLVYESKEERLQHAVQRLQERRPETSAPQKDWPETLNLDQFAEFLETQQGTVLDARPEIFHRLGHIPGALSLPRDDFENAYPALQSKLETDRTQPIAIYCASASCEDAELVKKALSALGFTRLMIYEGGWAEWERAGKPQKTSS